MKHKLSEQKMSNISERLKMTRQTLAKNKGIKISQAEFVENLGIAPNTYSQYESGKMPPSQPFIIALCKEYNVNQTWLETGEEEMFKTLSQDEEYGQVMGMVLAEQDPERQRILTVIMKTILELPPETYETIKQIARDILVEDTQNSTKKEDTE